MIGESNSLLGLLLVLIPALPLLAALIGYVLVLTRGQAAAKLNAWLGGLSLTTGALIAGWLLSQLGNDLGAVQIVRPWINLPDGTMLPIAFYGGQSQLLFALTTALIALVVLVFAFRDRRNDPRAGVFHATITLFAGAMLLFLLADNVFILYIAWELMGVVSYLLIAHPATAAARKAARQAFWTTRATDFGLLFAVLILLTHYGGLGWGQLSNIDIPSMLTAAQDPNAELAWLGVVALLILAAVLGKAAQFPLSFWLADAMVAPAPVSALLHAATMVAAGPYLLIRLHAFFGASEVALLVATLLGAVTMLLGAVMALTAVDPKRVLAYSTVSHLGLVIMAVGALAEEAGFFHLQVHAWFKAALFLGVGYLVVIHCKQHASTTGTATEKDTKPGVTLTMLAGSAQRYPLLLWGVLVPAGLSLAGLWPLAGALGKEQVLAGLLTRYSAEPVAGHVLGESFPLAAAGWQIASVAMLISLPLTAAYITRLVGILGWGNSDRATSDGAPDEHGVVTAGVGGSTDAGWNLPLALTAGLALMGSVGLAIGYYAWFATPAGFKPEGAAWKWASEGSGISLTATGVSIVFVVLAVCLTWYIRVAKPASGDKVFRDGGLAPLVTFFRNGMYLRELFRTVIGVTGSFIAVLAGRADIGIIDWLAEHGGMLGRFLAVVARWIDDHVVDGVRYWACEIWWLLKRLHARTMQTGNIQHYMFVVLVSMLLLCLVVIHALGQIMAKMMGNV